MREDCEAQRLERKALVAGLRGIVPADVFVDVVGALCHGDGNWGRIEGVRCLGM
jgi:hypothetical protein